ncbi:Mitochondrial copper homeostasis protein [Exophiala xenobiotica]|nr:Mitochondrial copper homeostasis protein [Exophiala xenobiotica]
MATSADSSQSTDQPVDWDKQKVAFQSKRTSEYYDPCQEAANKSIKCMNRNGGDRDMCQDYFQCVPDPVHRLSDDAAPYEGGSPPCSSIR